MDGSGPIDATAPQRLRVRVRGAVQGVGFRPFVWSLAQEMGLSGWVLNDDAGVLLEAEGAQVDQLPERLRRGAPPLARIDALTAEPQPPRGDAAFVIRKSAKTGAVKTAIPADVATCDACLEDIFDKAGRRCGYAFTNCTHCGPRYTITKAVPYDRAQTSMASFDMCPACQAEYDDPADRRFHAQPNACPDCGPQLSASPAEIVAHLRAGRIVAVKGLGGFHLAVDARNADAVARLRARKRRDAKPFAVMVAGLASAHRIADLDTEEAALLHDRARPIVVAHAPENAGLPRDVSDGLPTIGVMLPYTPLHYLLFHEAAGRPDGVSWLDAPQELVLVMTSANLGGEPLVTQNDEARKRLAGIADVIVDHDRYIVIRWDDSVMRVVDGAPAYLRRARGATPVPIKLARPAPATLALGGYLKNTVCVLRGDEAFLSQHIGDLDTAETGVFFRETVRHLLSTLDVAPTRVACDLHPDFLSSRCAAEFDAPLIRVQHHHAHIAAVAAEYGVDEPILGVALDGFGLGADGRSAWGGELLLADGATFERLGALAPLRQPGGDAAARAPWRMGAAALHALGRHDEIEKRFAASGDARLIAAMLARGVNAPETSSAGRLFDAACGLLGVRADSRYEGEAPMALEGLVDAPRDLPGGWTIEPDGTLNLKPLLAALCESDSRAGAALFHGAFAAGLAAWIEWGLSVRALPRRVALGGGCFQNKVLTETLAADLRARGIEPLIPRQAPANDGGLSLGQAYVAAATATVD